MLFEHCQAMRKVLAGTCAELPLTKRAVEALSSMRAEMDWVEEGRTALQWQTDHLLRWWTFGGLRANLGLAGELGTTATTTVRPTNLFLPWAGQESDISARTAIQNLAKISKGESPPTLRVEIDDEAIEQLKFSDCLPVEMAREELRARWADAQGATAVLGETVVSVA